ncbi:MAG: DUF481 domain-containing protein [Campylobacterota bacterium]|nr:DUF481 domain-containing protein [Campylobacterota bacterium]
MKYLFIITLLISSFVFAQEKKTDSGLVEVKDTSGLTQTQVRDIANQKDEAVQVKTQDVLDTIINRSEQGSVDISTIQASWEEMSPSAKTDDWIQTKSGEWFKGEIKAMFDEKLEFDSDEVGLYSFDFDDISQIKSYNVIGVNIENTAIFSGLIRFKDDEITIIQGDKIFTFSRKEIVSMAREGNKILDSWSGKISVSLDVRNGNKNQYDLVAKADIKRRTSNTRLAFDYLGRISSRNKEQTVNDHRLNQKFDVYETRSFFYTPVFSEYYQNKIKNIQDQITIGIGAGYEIINNSFVEWDLSGGPAYTYVEYISVLQGDHIVQAPAFEVMTHLDFDISKRIDFIIDYKLTYTSDEAGKYKHHMIITQENEITDWLDLDFTAVWDYLLYPRETLDGNIPVQSDFQFLIGLGIDF